MSGGAFKPMTLVVLCWVPAGIDEKLTASLVQDVAMRALEQGGVSVAESFVRFEHPLSPPPSS